MSAASDCRRRRCRAPAATMGASAERHRLAPRAVGGGGVQRERRAEHDRRIGQRADAVRDRPPTVRSTTVNGGARRRHTSGTNWSSEHRPPEGGDRLVARWLSSTTADTTVTSPTTAARSRSTTRGGTARHRSRMRSTVTTGSTYRPRPAGTSAQGLMCCARCPTSEPPAPRSSASTWSPRTAWTSTRRSPPSPTPATS